MRKTQIFIPHYEILFLILFYISTFQNCSVFASSAAGQETLIGIVGHDFVMLGADSSTSSSIAVTASNLDKILVLSDPFPFKKKHNRKSSEQQPIAAAAAGNAADADRLLGVLQAHVAVREYEASVGCDVECVFHGNDGSVSFDTPMGLDAEAVAHCARGEIASALRSATPFKLCLLIAGMVQTSQREPALVNVDASNPSQPNVDKEEAAVFANRIRSQINAAKHQINSVKSERSQQNQREVQINEHSHSSFLEPKLIWIDEYGSLQTVKYGAHGFGANFALSILDQGYRQRMTRSEALDLMKECFEQLRMRYIINSPQPPCIKCIDSNGCTLM